MAAARRASRKKPSLPAIGGLAGGPSCISSSTGGLTETSIALLNKSKVASWEAVPVIIREAGKYFYGNRNATTSKNKRHTAKRKAPESLWRFFTSEVFGLSSGLQHFDCAAQLLVVFGLLRLFLRRGSRAFLVIRQGVIGVACHQNVGRNAAVQRIRIFNDLAAGRVVLCYR